MTTENQERTPSGTLKRDPNAPKAEPPATPEERARRVAEARARAEAARQARMAGGGAPAPAAQTATPAPAPAAAAAPETEPVPAAEAVAAAGDGQLRTPKGTLKRDPNAPKSEPPATPEERARRVAEAKARAEAARRARLAGGGAAAPAAGLQPGAAAQAAQAAARPAAGLADAERAERRRVFETVTRPLPGAEPVLRPVVRGRAERATARAEFVMTEEMEDTVRLFREAVPDVTFEVLTSPLDPVLVIDRADVLKVMRAVRDHPALAMNYLRCISGVDQLDEGIEVVYHLKSISTKRHALVKTLLPLTDPVVDSVTPLWPAANWHERELMEMFGVICRGHPDPRNLLLDEDMTIHPLLKSHPLAEVELKQGVNVF
jgi:NADH-quinone oxidoreductase subunit C